MNIHNIKSTALIISGLFLASCASQPKQKTVSEKPAATKPATKPSSPAATSGTVKPKTLTLPTVNREFRAAWVATVANINWPSRNNLSVEQQKLEAVQMLDMLKDAHFNAVIFQARPSADALYKSDLEPWSYFLTGQTGKAPSPYYDPLEFWISEAHKRGMELHVWLNPYRAHHTTGGAVTGESMAAKMSSDTYRLRNGMYWMDPTSDRVQNHVSAVIKDLVKRYDLDAVHIDDYFYPYREYNGGADFPDSRTWTAYKNSGGDLSKADWRRANVNKFIKRIHDEIKAEKPYVKFGISPFGIWKPGYPADVTGSSQYDELFADAKLWLNEGWCDYYSPQLYWKEEGPQRFSSLLKWWKQENYKNIHLWPGLNTVGIKGVADKSQEISDQISTTRNLLGNGAGVIHYSIDGLSKDWKMLSAVKNLYREKALVPASPWIKTEPVLKPELTAKKNGTTVDIRWLSRKPQQVRNWILYSKYGSQWETQILNGEDYSLKLPLAKSGVHLTDLALKSVDRLGNESEYVAVEVH
ncbi:Uncharacterized protein conserved in bacteria [Chryseobacterium taklimakanense]|uniref:Uncharacterized protein conserved in bacteria n=1 Tax=Chryseobacterium taklimakanense TaxID=536441 RepID=A0A239WTK7_9FLAO|nr:family 10 glycosylhydrolase [Chryseobacterium taklimakanense]SNV37807.1 Uncharacterized protein conserved in bacteria [Chryseobacterium taklimakanense]